MIGGSGFRSHEQSWRGTPFILKYRKPGKEPTQTKENKKREATKMRMKSTQTQKEQTTGYNAQANRARLVKEKKYQKSKHQRKNPRQTTQNKNPPAERRRNISKRRRRRKKLTEWAHNYSKAKPKKRHAAGEKEEETDR
jgi:hypothetical protein